MSPIFLSIPIQTPEQWLVNLMKNDMLIKLENGLGAGGDLLLDEISDGIETGIYNVENLSFIVEKVLMLFSREADICIRESAMNLLSAAYPIVENVNKNKIEIFIAENLAQLEPGCLVHAISIIAESKMVAKNELLMGFKDCANKSVSHITAKYLDQLRRPT